VITCTSAANFFIEVGNVRKLLRRLLDCRCPLHSYRGLVRDLADRLYAACEEFGQAPGYPTYQREYEAAFDALGVLNTAVNAIPLDRAMLEQAFEFLSQLD